ncbi:MAG: DUF2252 family protein [Rhizobiales bacterium]|nr:DUF2252 family protein [Hyphomicrobiales bacterium]
MIPFAQSKRRYESWLRKALGKDLVAADLKRKNDIMADSAFVFLRGTYWRWAEMAFEAFPDLATAPEVLAVGDIHLENFGTWRDADGRLVWGINDFDEAAPMPYALDLVRLAASAALAANDRAPKFDSACDAILEGYRTGLASPAPVVLDRDWAWLRDKVVVPEEERQKFWKKIAARKLEAAPDRFRKALRQEMPEPRLPFDTARRVAGTGSLGRPRWIGVADWRGAPIVREAKAVLTSAWSLARGKPSEPVRLAEIAAGRFRAPDPWYRVANGIVSRRLSPNNRKIEAGAIDDRLHGRRMLKTMGFELANIHASARGAGAAIARDLKMRRADWLRTATEAATQAVQADYKQFTSS